MSTVFGIMKVKVLPPKGLYHPVLPYRSCGKLKFPLCRSCADAEKQTTCTCPDDKRAITGTWCTPEVKKAVEKGYKILKVYEIYHWKETSLYNTEKKEGGMFTEYINCFLKLKQQASGWPEECITESDKQKYIESYFEKEGIALDYNQIEKNPGLRSLAKLCLNSFWGKFGQRDNMTQTIFISEYEIDKFYNILTDNTVEVTDFNVVNSGIIQLKYKKVSGCERLSDRTNLSIASFTTCWARLKLYDLLDQLNDMVLYFDTDSVVFLSTPDSKFDVKCDNYLGGLTDELPSDYIVEFISAGPKNYAYRTYSGVEVSRVRGFNLNHANSKLVNFNSIKELVLGKESVITTCNPSKITRHSDKFIVYNRKEFKKYRMVYTKRVILPDLNTLPYGY